MFMSHFVVSIELNNRYNSALFTPYYKLKINIKLKYKVYNTLHKCEILISNGT